MQDRHLHRLRREELLEILLEVERENELLAAENSRLKQQLASRDIAITEAGSIAEASLNLSGVFASAQEAADLYIENVKRLSQQSEELLARTKEQCLQYANEVGRLCTTDTEVMGSGTDALVERVRSLFEDTQDEGGR